MSGGVVHEPGRVCRGTQCIEHLLIEPPSVARRQRRFDGAALQVVGERQRAVSDDEQALPFAFGQLRLGCRGESIDERTFRLSRYH